MGAARLLRDVLFWRSGFDLKGDRLRVRVVQAEDLRDLMGEWA